MKHIEVSLANWRRINKLRKEFGLKKNNQVVDEMFRFIEEVESKEK
jgi:hypothetical protein